ncbi:MAG: hypothetical protein F6J90_09325 [Moorea sp. SIOASIH]|uniref:hypothetical protein n=1 Tax=Moorena sp. SIOASIH TaxID=2607817 RepID=UPI0013B999AF|nr:hypothetical protein [Moorena sp. SIOASIH]NEO36514.1 hypothetical protein [Moorena sp. SIOASIH]
MEAQSNISIQPSAVSYSKGNREQGTGNREQGTGNREQGTGNREQGTESQLSAISYQLSATPCPVRRRESSDKNYHDNEVHSLFTTPSLTRARFLY